MLSKYFKRIFIAFSALLNVILGGANNQTFSARNYDRQKRKKLNLVQPIDFFLGKDHCKECWAYWKVRRDW